MIGKIKVPGASRRLSEFVPLESIPTFELEPVNLEPDEIVIDGFNWRRYQMKSVAKTLSLKVTNPNRHLLFGGSERELSSVNLGNIRLLKRVLRSHQEKRKFVDRTIDFNPRNIACQLSVQSSSKWSRSGSASMNDSSPG
jgi:hypothetical protein